LPKKVKKMINAIKQALTNSFSYENYRKHVTELITKGLSTGHTPIGRFIEIFRIE
jgi:hypothetical protein